MYRTRVLIDMSRSQRDGGTRVIRFRKVFTAYAIRWFAFVQRGAHLTVNGQSYPNTHDIVIGPLAPFSVLEYNDRAVFLYLNRESVEYKPGGPGLQPAISRVLASLKNDHDSGSKEGTTVAKAALTTGAPIATQTSAKIEPEIQPDGSDPCEYYRSRMEEWRLLQSRSGTVLIDPATQAGFYYTGEWLVDSVVFRAIASVTTAIGLENDMDFAMIDEWGYGLARRYPRPKGMESLPLTATGRNKDLFLPYNTSEKGHHWLLVHAKCVNDRPEIHIYDSLNMMIGSDEPIKRIVVNTTLYDVDKDIDDNLHKINLTHHNVATQPGSWQCGYLTILNAWCVALGMEPGAKRHDATSTNRIRDLIGMINLSMAGFMDSATIQAFMRCVGFVDADHNTVASDRHFTRSVPFLTKESLNKYILMRRELEKHPESAIRRLDLATIRLLLDPELGDFEDLDNMNPETLLEHFDRWLKDRNLVEGGPTSPLSPISPDTIRLTFGIARSANTGDAPLPVIPDDTRLLRKIWNIYHKMLKRQGHLGLARQERAKDIANGHYSTQEISDHAEYPYDDPRVVALDRLGMLPTKHTLTAVEQQAIGGNSRPVIKLKLKHS